MRRSTAQPRSGRRRARRVLLASVAVVLTPVVWTSDDLMLRAAYAITIAVAAIAAVRARRRMEAPAAAYVRALRHSAALHVRLSHAGVAAVHAGERETLVTFTWRTATTTLLDADGRARPEVDATRSPRPTRSACP